MTPGCACLPATADNSVPPDSGGRFRGATYQITVHNPDGASRRVGHLLVDGARVGGTLVPMASAGATVAVEAIVTKTERDG